MPEIAAEHCGVSTEDDERATLRTLNAFAIDLISIPNRDDLFWYIAQNVVGPMRFVDCVVYRANEEQTSLFQAAAMGEKNPFGRSIVNPMKIAFGEGITGQAAQSREAIIVDDLRLSASYIEDTEPARSEICVPIMCGNQVAGVIDCEHPKPGAFGDAELELLTTIAAMTSAKLDLLAEAERSRLRYHDLVSAHAELSQAGTNRKALEAELYDARKLETVGRLTGRFAHEFNNLLTVISGNLELLEGIVPSGSIDGSLCDARAAADRAADLIQSMLAYSQRKHMSPQHTDINVLVKNIIAQKGPSETHPVNFKLEQEVKRVNVDQSIFETALLHLVHNARDAMPRGGTVHLETDSVVHSGSDKRSVVTRLLPGEYVRLSVRDDGEGLSADEMQQVFDPFYTTKPVGAGTGLGLSLILGFMQQSGGSVGVRSATGVGSVFQLYFPAQTVVGKDLLTINH